MGAWPIAEGTETRPVPAAASAPTTAEITQIDSWNKRERQGQSLLVLVVQPAIYQSIDLVKTLAENWTSIKMAYGRRTGLINNAWVDFRTYMTTTFDAASPISQQIDMLSELHAKIVQGGLTVLDQLHALVMLGSLPVEYLPKNLVRHLNRHPRYIVLGPVPPKAPQKARRRTRRA